MENKTIAYSLLLAVILALPCCKKENPVEAPLKVKSQGEIREEEKNAVIKTVLEDGKVVYQERSLFVVVSSTINILEILGSSSFEPPNVDAFMQGIANSFSKKKNIAIPPEVLRDFVGTNQTRKPCTVSHASKKVVLLSEEELVAIFSEGEYESFYEKYPGSAGYIRFSDVGFNDNFTVALVYVEEFANSTGAGGGMVFLEKAEARWVVKGFVYLWAS